MNGVATITIGDFPNWASPLPGVCPGCGRCRHCGSPYQPVPMPFYVPPTYGPNTWGPGGVVGTTEILMGDGHGHTD